MRLMFEVEKTTAPKNHNPIFLEEEEARRLEADGVLRPATQEEMAGLANMLARLLAEMTSPTANIQQAVIEVTVELQNATRLFGPFHSAHEALGVIQEEFVEFQQEVFKRPKERNLAAMRTEACQLAAMAMRVMVDLC